ncbi:cathelicidin-2-like [Carettochelys insculpta]|uniref:cathelicidin-2-like n=1 Tax=Carettochelys insculpta TaxID=44489 RepID=UPI003EC0E02A
MASGWACLLLLVAVASAAPVKTPEPYEQAIARAIDFYNRGPTVTNAFRLLTSGPPPEVGLTSNTLQQLNFTIMETTCPASGKAPVEQCDFKDNGLVRDCSGHFSTDEACPVVAITCDSAPTRPVHVTRWWIPAVRLGAKVIGHAISIFKSRN